MRRPLSRALRSGRAPVAGPRVAAHLAFAAHLALASAVATAADPMRPTPLVEAPVAGRAPAAAARAEPATAPALRLVSIRVDAGERRTALVGDHWVQPGDAVDGWRVAAIDADEVRLVRGAERRTLSLWTVAAPTPSNSRTSRP